MGTGWTHTPGACAALVPRPDGNGDEEAAEGAPAKEPLLGAQCKYPRGETTISYQTRPGFSRTKLPAPSKCSIPGGRRGLKSHLPPRRLEAESPRPASFLSVPAQPSGLRASGLFWGKKLKQEELTKNKPLGVSRGAFHSNLQPRTLDFQEGAFCPCKEDGA